MRNGTVGICLVGAGRAGMIHGVNFQKNVPNARMVAVADPFEDACKDACKQLEIDTYYLDYKQALENPKIDAFVVVSPTIYHRDIVVDAAKAGKHILCEKPMGLREHECDEMITACDAARVNLQIGFMRRFDQSFMAAEQSIKNGDIGDVVMVRSNTRGPSVPQRWMYDIRMSNGPLAEVNSHDIDTLRWFTGAEFESVYCVAGNYRCPEAREEFPDFYDNVSLVARFDNNMQGIIDGAVSVNYGYDARVEILGTHGCIYLGQVHEQMITTVTRAGCVRPAMTTWRHLFREAYRAEDIHFVECILEGKTPRVTGVDGKMAVKVVHAGNTSIMEKRIVTL